MDQQTKFCFKCGAKIPLSAIYCPKCGTKQPSTDAEMKDNTLDVPLSEISAKATSDQIAIDALIPPTNMSGVNRDIRPERISEYKQEMGFPGKVDNVLYIQNNYMKKMLLIGALATLNNKMMFVSFEEQGILFVGYDLVGHFNGVNTFVPNNEIQEIHLTSGVMQNKLKIVTVKERLNFLAPKLLVGAPYQKQNLNSLMEKFK